MAVTTFIARRYMQAGRKYGMRLLDDHIVELLQQGKVDPKHAYQMAANKELVRQYLTEKGPTRLAKAKA